MIGPAPERQQAKPIAASLVDMHGAELAIVGHLLLNCRNLEAWDACSHFIRGGEYFENPACAIWWNAIARSVAEFGAYSPETCSDLIDDKHYKLAGGAFLVDAEYWARSYGRVFAYDLANRHAKKALQAAATIRGDHKAAVIAVEGVIARIGVDRRPADESGLAELMKQAVAAQGSNVARAGVATCFPSLDAFVGGLGYGQMSIVAARPSMGKTALALQIAVEAATAAEPTPVAFVSLEMTKNAVVERIMSHKARVPLELIHRGHTNGQQRAEMAKALDAFGSAPFWLISPHELDAIGLSKHVARYAADGVKLFVIDYLGLMEMPRAETQNLAIAALSRAVKRLAIEHGVHVMVVSQLNRGVESRPEQRPRLSDIRDSGALEQDADVVLLLYRRGYYKSDLEDADTAELIVAKNRQGRTGVVRLEWVRAYASFESRVDHPGAGAYIV